MLSKRITIAKDIRILLSLAVALILVRVVAFDTYSLMYMLWNIFLALLPLGISTVLFLYTKQGYTQKVFLSCIFVAWLLLIPNAPYLITDLIHVGHYRGV